MKEPRNVSPAAFHCMWNLKNPLTTYLVIKISRPRSRLSLAPDCDRFYLNIWLIGAAGLLLTVMFTLNGLLIEVVCMSGKILADDLITFGG